MPQRQSLSHGRGSLESNAISNTSIMGSPHGAAMPYNNQLRDSIVSLGGSSDLERMVLRKVDRNSKGGSKFILLYLLYRFSDYYFVLISV